ncbi:MAG: hypothetical protein IT330_04880 [Anaerolineae bacterium]|nr:hypothetical protein [Anaerolineae bacterium]
MSKSGHRRKDKTRTTVNLPASTFLRSRLDNLWSSETLPQQDQAAIYDDLDAMARGVKPDLLLQTMIRAYLAASTQAQARLEQVIPGWLRDRHLLATLEEIVAGQRLAGELQPRALAWLAAAGQDTHALVAQLQDTFYEAYFFGDDSQATLSIFWYADHKKTRARGFNFLIDYNPPWDGAIKDIILFPQRETKEMVAQITEYARGMGSALEPISAVEAKQKALQALTCNRKSKIRLPRDLIAAREYFIRYVLSLPGGPETPSITVEDVDFLSRNGQLPEEIMHFEQTVGRRVRMEDGKEILIRGFDLDDTP